jgi:hypothetical protein
LNQQPATTESAAAAGPRVVKLADAASLKDLTTDDRQASLTDKLAPPQATQTIYFGELDTYANDDDEEPSSAVPIIAVRDGEAWRALPLGGPGFVDAGWKYVGAGPGPREIWGGIDTVAGGSRPRFALVHSTDGGETFELIAFRKPCRLATFFDFAMDRDGHGRATLSLDSDCGKYKAGLYHYETSDDGKTWSAEPRYEADAMIRADDVPEDEQPNAPSEGAKQTMFRNAHP